MDGQRSLRRAVLGLGLALLLATVGRAAGPHDAFPSTDATDIDCLLCHDCEEPRPSEPCFKPCPSRTMLHMTSKHPLSEAPEMLLLDDLAEQYLPVDFNHKLHAEMAEMGNNCATCHHFSPPGRVPGCAECHGAKSVETNLRQPSLKGAYHRQCLSCHREWSHDTKCVLCHLPADALLADGTGIDSTDIIGISHPVITEPVKRVFNTPYKDGPIVTFHHKEHIELFDLTCANCHKEENCSYCHDLQKPARLAKTQEEVHAICNDCHAEAPCSKCHDTMERPGFSHEATGWALTGHHQDLGCRACHPTGKRITRIAPSCVNCHAGWTAGNFSHVITGLRLDETHAELDCEYCHLDLAYDEEPDCSNCHEDGRAYVDAPPGEVVRPLRAHKKK